MAIVLYLWGFLLVPLVVQYAGFAADGREVYALHGGAVVVAVLFLLLGPSRQSSVISDAVVQNPCADDKTHQTKAETISEKLCASDDAVVQESVSMSAYRDNTQDDHEVPSVMKTPWYIRVAIVCATKLWSLVSFAWLCLLGVALVIPVYPWYFVGVGSILLIVWLWGGLVRHPFPFSFFGFAMHVREWVQWIGLCVVCGVVLLFGDSGKFSVRFFVGVSSVLVLFWVFRVCIPRIRRIRGSKFRLFRLLTGVWFVLLATILFQAFLFARGHIIQSRQHMYALMREYMMYQFRSFAEDVGKESPLGSLFTRFVFPQTSLSVSQDGSFGEGGVSGSGLLLALSGDDAESEIFVQVGRRKHTGSVPQKEKDREPDPEQDTVTSVEPTFRVIVRFLLATYPKTTTRYTFANVPATDPDYPFFATARHLNMIGTDVDPNRLVLCQTFFVMQGLAEGWTVSGQGTIFEKYWNEARRRGVVGSCEWGKTVPASLYRGR
ncbi:MAG: hypothetical protein NZL83_01375 [Candidatus Absconditabacterales bacterium]|nr:hypothetical protein [Candidatus Absconditabacterales bacterium]